MTDAATVVAPTTETAEPLEGNAHVDPTWLLTEELKGKMAAIHAYDRIIWQVRAGFTTLVGAAWALTLNGVIGENGFVPEATEIFGVLATLTVGIAVIAYLIDDSYMKRKFRVITSANELMKVLTEAAAHDLSPDDSDFWRSDRLKRVMVIAGDSTSIPPERDGLRNARIPAYQLYGGGSLIFVAVGLFAGFIVA